MDEPYIGEIRPVSFSYAPRGWAMCNGQLLNINTNAALFSLLGTQFGGNGVTTFGLPDLRGRAALGKGQQPGSTAYTQGDTGGVEQVALNGNQVPSHTHTYTGALQTGSEAITPNPKSAFPAAQVAMLYTNGPANTAMGTTIAGDTSSVGNGQGHENRQPYLALNYVIALTGLFPSRQ